MQAEEEKYPRITDDFLKKLLRSDIRIYYSTRYLNDKLYLHYKGFHKIENLSDFTGLKVLYIEGNAIEKIEGLENCTDLRCLYIQENCIREISGLDTLSELYTLNLSDNMIRSISGLSNNQKLNTLLLQRNSIGANGLQDILQLADLKSLSVLDLSHNKIDDPEILPQVLEKMPQIGVLYLQGNPVCKKIENYRKVITYKLPNLKYLDDRPIFEEDRRFAQAFAIGGIQAEREERKKWQEEKEAERLRNHLAFREMVEKHRNERVEQEAAKSSESTTMSEGSSDEWNSSNETPEVSYIGSRGSETKSEDELPPLEEVKIEDIPFITGVRNEDKEEKENFTSKLIVEEKKEKKEEEFKGTKIMIEEVNEGVEVKNEERIVCEEKIREEVTENEEEKGEKVGEEEKVASNTEESEEILNPEIHKLDPPSKDIVEQRLNQIASQEKADLELLMRKQQEDLDELD
ncbi:unnamed protein product [Blepharisma stoltei]|uniref:Dynein assembly factor 1, axonemal homolog n=1 Tax=Blepharisma stoltei TaxID=1481888 RepID=A0AAU9JDF1_9CILI|nr:unnamed protein product [Blepharisma stoltei]